jgi:hypothetical protein
MGSGGCWRRHEDIWRGLDREGSGVGPNRLPSNGPIPRARGAHPRIVKRVGNKITIRGGGGQTTTFCVRFDKRRRAEFGEIEQTSSFERTFNANLCGFAWTRLKSSNRQHSVRVRESSSESRSPPFPDGPLGLLFALLHLRSPQRSVPGGWVPRGTGEGVRTLLSTRRRSVQSG